MLKLRSFVAGLVMILVAATVQAELKQGRDYDLINPPQPTEKGKVEVVEFFSYMCPHCDHLDPVVSKWQKTLGKDVLFQRVPVIFPPQWEAPARLYYTLDALGELEKFHGAVFTAVHRENTDLTKELGVINWAEKKGLDRKKFSDTYNSFTVKSKVAGIEQKQKAYGIPGVPAFVVAGKYRTPDDYSGSFEELLRAVDEMIVKARAEQGKK